MNVATKERPAPASVKPMAAVRRQLWALRRVLSLVLQRTFAVPSRYVGRGLRFLGDLPANYFVPAVGVGTACLKAGFMPLAALLSGLIFTPLGLTSFFAPGPILMLSDYLTRLIYNTSFIPLGWAWIAALVQLLVTAIGFGAAATLLSQFVPLVALRKLVPSQGWRICISLLVMSALYVLCWGDLAYVFTGAVIGLPLTYTYLHWRRRASVSGAFLVTGSVHATVIAVAIIFHLLFGGI